MPTKDEARLGASVYLLKKTQVANARKAIIQISQRRYRLVERLPGARLFVLPTQARAPGWIEPLSELLVANSQPNLLGQFPGALLWLPYDRSTFVFAFGSAHAKVRKEWVVGDFGKVVAEAVVSQECVRNLRVEQVFAKRHVADERAPRTASLSEFGFESDRDLVGAIEGSPDTAYEEIFGKRVRGSASLKFELDVSRLADSLDMMLERYKSNEHKQRWPQANNLEPVRDEELVSRLDAKLAKYLAGDDRDDRVSLATPSEVGAGGSYPQYFVLGRMSRSPAYRPYLALSDWEAHLRRRDQSVGLEMSRKTVVHLFDDEKNDVGSCSMYQCLGCEVQLDGSAHVLSSGNWYAASADFIAGTDQKLAALGAPARCLCDWNGGDCEGEYNEKACAADTELWLFDKQLVNYGGGRSRLEYCDIMHHATRTLYFVKHYSGSAGVSHLCEQARRTAEMFFDTDDGYRQKLKTRIENIGKAWETDWLEERPQRHNWNLCLVLMGRSVDKLPLFAKAGIARLISDLERRGYNVSFQAV